MFETILCEVTEYDASVLEPLIGLAVEISREGRDENLGNVFIQSRHFILETSFNIRSKRPSGERCAIGGMSSSLPK
jgi:hypothetical protein